MAQAQLKISLWQIPPICEKLLRNLLLCLVYGQKNLYTPGNRQKIVVKTTVENASLTFIFNRQYCNGVALYVLVNER